jgi:hypothetical protein
LQVLKGNSAFDAPREKVSDYFSRGDLFLTADFHICFVCGAATEIVPLTGQRSVRAIFIDYVNAHTEAPILCVRAESALTELLRYPDERRKSAISKFETVVAESVDSVLIFPESPGSFAELGFFSADQGIADKTLVAIAVEHQGPSFITLGPISLVARASQFGPIPLVLDPNPADSMPRIVSRLLGDQPEKRPYRKRFLKQAWKDFPYRTQLALLDEILDLTGALTEGDLLNIININFGNYDVSTVRLLLSLLVATGRIEKDDNGDIFSMRRDRRFIHCETAGVRLEVGAMWHAAYAEHFPDVPRKLKAIRA